MNRDELEAKLAQQRKWREIQNATPKPKKAGFALFAVIVTIFSASIIIVIMVGLYAWATKRVADVPTPAPVAVSAPSVVTVIEITPTTTPIIIMQVCAGIPTAKLHVRVTPNGEVRGYLNEGEQVTLSLDERGKPITSDQSWTQIDSPINGWVSTRFICK